jgi:DNA-binding NtrC family response regulator
MKPTGEKKHMKVLVVDDESSQRQALARLVGRWGYETETVDSAEGALAFAEDHKPAVVITDLVLPQMDGVELLHKLKETERPPAVLVVTGHSGIESAVEAMREGAWDYLTKPVDADRLQLLLSKAVEQFQLTREVTLLRHQLRQKGSFGPLIGESKHMQEVYRWVELAASSTAPVLVHGESGTGKELVARTIHDLSKRHDRPFVAVNCAAMPESIIESELFGHERGAFTGATERRMGCFELADGGTLLLDEISEMDTFTQAKLLRVLQEGAFRRVGGAVEVRVDVRVVAATNRAPTAALTEGKLREDLFYRLNVFSLRLPPLRERAEDIPSLAATFIDEFNRQDQREVRGLTAEAAEAMATYGWPGNVRELRNVTQLAVVLASSGAIDVGHLPPQIVERKEIVERRETAERKGGPRRAPSVKRRAGRRYRRSRSRT